MLTCASLRLGASTCMLMPQVLPVSETDYPELAVFLTGFYPACEQASFWLRRFRLWWEHNPMFVADLPRGWAIRDNMRIVGFIGNIPSAFQLDYRSITAFNATTWRVLPGFRSYSLELLMRLVASAKDTVLFNTTPNSTVERVLGILKFQPIPNLARSQSVVVLNWNKVLASYLGSSWIAKILAATAGPPCDVLQLARGRRTARERAIDVREVSLADSSFDDLWSRTKRQFANTKVRSADVLNWYCFGNPDFRKVLFGCYVAERMLGYAAFMPIADGNRESLVCMDLWFEEGAIESVLAVIEKVREYALSNDFDLIAIPHFNSTLGSYLSRAGLFTRPKAQAQYLKVTNGLSTLETNSYFTAEGDLGI